MPSVGQFVTQTPDVYYCTIHTERFVKKRYASLRKVLVLSCASAVNSGSVTSEIAESL